MGQDADSGVSDVGSDIVSKISAYYITMKYIASWLFKQRSSKRLKS